MYCMTCEMISKWKSPITFNGSNMPIKMGCLILEKQKKNFLIFFMPYIFPNKILLSKQHKNVKSTRFIYNLPSKNGQR